VVVPLVVLALLLAFPAGAQAGNETWTTPSSLTKPPPGKRLNLKTVLAKGEATKTVTEMRRKYPTLRALGYLDTSTGNWLIRYVIPDKELVEVDIDDATGQVTDVWTGPQVLWGMARGVPGAFGRKLNAAYLWLPLCLLFILPFFDPRRPFRLLHLDLLVMLAFGVSHFFFNRADISASTPLAYPVLAYLLVRAAMIGFRPRKRPGPLVPLVPIRWLAAGLIFLVGFRIGLNVFDSNVIDVGYAGVLGANRIAHGLSLYDWNLDWHPNTYGPITYLAYMPFEWIWPNHGAWDDLPAAHAASVTFDLLTTVGLYVLGRRLREGQAGRTLGIVLAYAWVAYPYSAYVLESNSNDALTAALVVWALVFMRSPAMRGALLAVAGAVKFAPLALVPLFGSGRGERRGLQWLLFLVAFTTVLALAILPFTQDVGLRKFWDATAGYQADRPSPFSIWGLYDGLTPLRRVLEAGTLGFGIALAAIPRRRSELQIAALAAAVLIAVELCVSHWFYLYIVWFTPPLLAALFGEYGSRSWRIPVALPAASASIRTPLSHGSSSDGSKRAGTWVRNLVRACSRRTPITPPRAPVIPTSVT
jgi:glycosyl transferase family 87